MYCVQYFFPSCKTRQNGYILDLIVTVKFVDIDIEEMCLCSQHLDWQVSQIVLL